MKPLALYNEIDPHAAQWLRNLIKKGHIADGIVDERSIEDITPADFEGFTQFHAFAGIGLWSLALRRAGWQDDWPIWTGSCPCFTAGTLVFTDRGNIPVETVAVGDSVWTHEHRWQKVVKVGSQFSEVGILSGHGHSGLTVTPDHPFYARERSIQSTRRDGKSVNLHSVSDSKWTTASQMPGRWWAMERQFPETTMPGIPGLSPSDFGFLCGVYVGDGWTGTGTRENQVILGVTESKRAEIEARLPGVKFDVAAHRTGVKMHLRHPELAVALLRDFKKGAENKELPTWLFSAPRDVQDRFLEGWHLTDGTRGSGRLTTVSRSLAVTGRMLLVAMGYSTSMRKIETPDSTVIEGRTVNQRDYYTIDRSMNPRYTFEREGFSWFKAKSFTLSPLRQRVYNLEVDCDNSYLADGIVVHNCQPFSAAGEGKGFADERHLWPAWHWLIDQCRPPKILGEQVASKDGLKWFSLVSSDLEGSGYGVGAADLCAAGFGAFHIRQRLWFVAHADHAGSQGRLLLPERAGERALGSGGLGRFGMADTDLEQRNGTGGTGARGWQEPSDLSGAGRMADTHSGQRHGVAEIGGGNVSDGAQTGRDQSDGESELGGAADFWMEHASGNGRLERGTEPVGRGVVGGCGEGVMWHPCQDGKYRPIPTEQSFFPLAHGNPGRVGKLRAYGNGIHVETAQAFVTVALGLT